MNEIVARRLKIILKNGRTEEYTHITKIFHTETNLYIDGETDDVANGRVKLKEVDYDINQLNLMIVEFYKPRT